MKQHVFFRLSILFVSILTIALWQSMCQTAFAQISIGGDERVQPEEFTITVFADGLNFPVGMAQLPDGSIVTAVSNGNSFFASPSGSLIRLVDNDNDGVADEQSVLVNNVPGGGLTTVRIAGNYVFTTGQAKPISIYHLGEQLSDPLTLVGTLTLDYAGGGWLHPHSTLAVRQAPGLENQFDLYFQLGSSENFAVTTRTLPLSSTIGASETLTGDAIYHIRLVDNGETLQATSVNLIAQGLRNASGLDFHPETGDLYIAENGIDGLEDVNEPHSADELNIIPASELGNTVIDFGFPSSFVAYRTGETNGSSGVAPIVAFQPIPDPFTGAESEGPNDIAFSPPGFPKSLQNGIFVTFHGKFSLGGVANEENPLVYVDLDTNDYFHFVSNTLPDVGHLDGLLSTQNSLYIADLSPDGGLGEFSKNEGVIYRVTANSPTDTSVDPLTDIGIEFDIYPNPANEHVTISFAQESPSGSRVEIFDSLGRRVRTFNLAQGERSLLLHWDGRNNEGYRVATGVYFVVLQTNHQVFAEPVSIR